MKIYFFLFSLMLGLNLGAQELQLMTEQNAPLNFEKDGKVQGISPEVLDKVMEAAGLPYDPSKIAVYPWARGYEMVQKVPNSMLFAMGRTEEREKLFSWVGPLYKLTLGIIVPKSKKIRISLPEDLLKISIGTVREGAPEQLTVRAGVPVEKLDRNADLETMLRKFALGRVDAIAFNVPSAFYTMKTMGLNPADYEVVYTLREMDLYYALNKETSPALVQKLQAAFDKVRATGIINTIADRYLK